MRQHQSGFTLVEIAIVLVIIGLLLGGILQGQQMINNARVRSAISTMQGISTAYYAFQDRYKQVPGDWNGVQNVVPGAVNCSATCGNGLIDNDVLSSIAFNNLAAAGFLSGSFDGGPPTATNTPTNPYGGRMQIINDANYYTDNATTGPVRLAVKSGNNIPVGIAREIDVKLDNANPRQGTFRVVSTGAVAGVAACNNGTAAGAIWDTAAATPAANCSGALLM